MAQIEADLRASRDRAIELEIRVAEAAAKQQKELDEHCRESITLKGKVHELKCQLGESELFSIDLKAKVDELVS